MVQCHISHSKFTWEDASLSCICSFKFVRFLALFSDCLHVLPGLCPEMSTAKTGLYLGPNKL